MSPNEILAWSGLVIGLAFGAVGQATGFCLNRAVKDYVETYLKQDRSRSLCWSPSSVRKVYRPASLLISRLLFIVRLTFPGFCCRLAPRCLAMG